MGRKTQFLNLHLADANDVYDVEVDQNQNFKKIDKKLKELDTGKETAFSKKSGFNLEKTDEYNLDDTNKLGTAKALKRLFDEIVSRIKLINWDNLTGKPKTFPPNSHTHDDRYYKEIETDDRITGLAGRKNGKFPLSSAIKGNVYLLEQTQKFYVCTQNYSGTTISVPNANFTELSIYENMNRLENLLKFRDITLIKDLDSNLFSRYTGKIPQDIAPSKVISVILEEGSGAPGGYSVYRDIIAAFYYNYQTSNTRKAKIVYY